MKIDEELTPEETNTIGALVAAWNAFLLLPREHKDDTEDFRFHIHAAQNIIAGRPTFRAYINSRDKKETT